MKLLKLLPPAALIIFCHLAISKDFSLTAVGTPACIGEGIVDKPLTKGQLYDIFKSKLNMPDEFISDWSCSGDDEINIGINGDEFLLKKYSDHAFGLPPLGYMSENGDIKVEIDQLEYVLIDKIKADSMELDPGVYCYPTYRRVRVKVEFKGMTKTVLGTTIGTCPD